MNLRETFAANLRYYRQEKGVSQEDLAHRAGLDRTYISSLERSVYSASIDVIEKVALVLEVEPHRFLKVRNQS
ncbi:helix-turn-helix domain-containing protein [Hoeflea poritis]|uniref:Helix-turn-helix transcriptional regulator n=1 Tax=Hoeflea poritis TaxID=2993659 RepID=A0ABT4VX52_9HYPH|nr:helix-turn-helix transcriptional regulator [Hoeflea poritis]MDA4848588.1 helix-turn-helix transcriptional regulator [Hoeflea poritis]